MATWWPAIAVSLKSKITISSIHLHILMDLALRGHGGIVLWKDKWRIQETNLKLLKIWGELISSAWLKQVCKGFGGCRWLSAIWPYWEAGLHGLGTELHKYNYVFLGHRLIHLLSSALPHRLTCWGFAGWGISVSFPFPWCRDVLEDAALVILGSQLSLKLFLSLPGPWHVSCNELGAVSLSIRGSPWLHVHCGSAASLRDICRMRGMRKQFHGALEMMLVSFQGIKN